MNLKTIIACLIFLLFYLMHRHAENRCKPADADLTAEDCSQLPNVVCLDDLDRGDSLKRRTLNSGLGSRQHLNQISTTCSASLNWSTVVSEQNFHKGPCSVQIPSVTFDLGNEWDEWGDFDDENLLNASEISVPPCKTSFKPQMQQHVQNKMAGYATTSAPVLISSSQAKPYMTTFTTPLSPEISKLGPCPVSHSFTSQNRITLDWDEKRPNIFSDGLTIKTPEKLPGQTLGGQVSRRLDFFSTMNASSSANSSLNKSSEEEAFLGIFDGIF
ncbi:hypothetical protein ILYODFUR_008915 [Ilyodon furcidens]|uniref:Uncharacterized protein n=1 Tax=Ilyodon furcidens TaxID=33524 RepID=A0ABV0TXA7_9TELE